MAPGARRGQGLDVAHRQLRATHSDPPRPRSIDSEMMSRAFRASSKERSCDTLLVSTLRKQGTRFSSKKRIFFHDCDFVISSQRTREVRVRFGTKIARARVQRDARLPGACVFSERKTRRGFLSTPRVRRASSVRRDLFSLASRHARVPDRSRARAIDRLTRTLAPARRTRRRRRRPKPSEDASKSRVLGSSDADGRRRKLPERRLRKRAPSRSQWD